MTGQRSKVEWQDAWTVGKASAKRRLGRPLLVASLALALFAIAVVAGSIVAMHV